VTYLTWVAASQMCKWHECMHLDVSRNHLRAVPKDLGKLKAMQDLTLHHNVLWLKDGL